MKKYKKNIIVLLIIGIVIFCSSLIVEKNIYNDYKLVYNYNYYATHYPEIAKECNNDKYRMLRYFITNGMKNGQQACDNFDVIAYRSANKDLRLLFGDDYEKYYAHYMEYGYKEDRQAIGIKTAYDE